MSKPPLSGCDSLQRLWSRVERASLVAHCPLEGQRAPSHLSHGVFEQPKGALKTHLENRFSKITSTPGVSKVVICRKQKPSSGPESVQRTGQWLALQRPMNLKRATGNPGPKHAPAPKSCGATRIIFTGPSSNGHPQNPGRLSNPKCS
jgi:hypothetical protein